MLKRADALEQITGIDTIALDKTGTLTEGKFGIADRWFADPTQAEYLFNVTASLEARSEHPISKAFSASESLAVSEFEVTAGGGIRGGQSGWLCRR